MAENAKEGKKGEREENGTTRHPLPSLPSSIRCLSVRVRPLICRLPLRGFLPEHGVPVRLELNFSLKNSCL